MVPEISSVTGRMFCHLGQLFAHLPLKNLKNQNFEKMKKMPGDIIILHKCTKNQVHTLYYSWHMVSDRCNCYFLFWTIFCPFTPLTARKMKISKKWKKKSMEISSFTQVYQKSWSYAVLFLKYSFWAIFCPFTPLTAQKIKIKKEMATDRWTDRNCLICTIIVTIELWQTQNNISLKIGAFYIFFFWPEPPQYKWAKLNQLPGSSCTSLNNLAYIYCLTPAGIT